MSDFTPTSSGHRVAAPVVRAAAVERPVGVRSGGTAAQVSTPTCAAGSFLPP